MSSASAVTAAETPAANGHGEVHSTAGFKALMLGSIGVVYGDIGTSPLYAVKETFNPEHGIPLTPETILGGLSAIFWSLMIVVSLKYVTLIMRADNKGEGGVLALATLGTHGLNGKGRKIRVGITLLAVVGLALFYGDAIITPAVTVLSAVEGLSAVAPAFGSVSPRASTRARSVAGAPRKATNFWGRVAGDVLAIRVGSIAPLPASGTQSPFEPDLARGRPEQSQSLSI